MTGFEWPWVSAAKRREASRAELQASKDAAREAVKAKVAETPYRVTQNPDGTWRAWRCYADSRYHFGVGFLDFVTWVEIERVEALPTRAKAEAAVRRYIAARVVVLGADGRKVES